MRKQRRTNAPVPGYIFYQNILDTNSMPVYCMDTDCECDKCERNQDNYDQHNSPRMIVICRLLGTKWCKKIAERS